jgi:hypothetical protein
MKLSLYTGVKDGLFYDFHVEAMLRHHLPLADQIVVNEGFSTDGTFEAISQIDSKIQIGPIPMPGTGSSRIRRDSFAPVTGASCSTVMSSYPNGSSRGCGRFSKQPTSPSCP